MTVTNTSAVALPLSSIEIGGADAVHYVITDTVYEVSNTTDGILDAGKSMDVTVKFEPNGGLLSSGAEVTLSNAQIKIFLNIDTGYPTGENPLEISLSGVTQKKPDIAVYESDGATLLINDNESAGVIDLGDVVVGQTATSNFRLKNVGVGQLSLLESCFANSGCNDPKYIDSNFSYTTNHSDPTMPPATFRAK